MWQYKQDRLDVAPQVGWAADEEEQFTDSWYIQLIGVGCWKLYLPTLSVAQSSKCGSAAMRQALIIQSTSLWGLDNSR